MRMSRSLGKRGSSAEVERSSAMAQESRNELRKRRHWRNRGKIYGRPERPRLCLYKSLRHICAQIIDDTEGRTLAAASTLDKEFNGTRGGATYGSTSSCNIGSAKKVGQMIAKRALAQDITEVVFDRSGYPYHGRVKALAESAREEGLRF